MPVPRATLLLGLWFTACTASPEESGARGSASTPAPGSTTPSGTTSGSTPSTGTSTAGTGPSTGTGTGSGSGTGSGTGTPTGTASTPAVELITHGVQACADPGARDLQRLDRVELGFEGQEWIGIRGSGVAVADLDGDGRVELVRTRDAGLEHWERNADGSWTATGILDHVVADHAAAASAADFDADGDLDLFVGRFGHPNLLLRNDGDTFTDVAAALGLERQPRLTLASAWADADLDGDLDLAVANYGETPVSEQAVVDPSRLYLGTAGEPFVDVSHWLPEDRVQRAYTFMFAWVDTNGDRFPELVAVNDFPHVQSSRILVNQAGAGLEPDDENGFQSNFGGMGIGIGDDNDDGIVDFVQSSTGEHSVMLSVPTPANPSGGTWIEHAHLRGLVPHEPKEFGWGTEWADMDNDGDLDVVLLNGFWDDFQNRVELTVDADMLWLRDDDGAYTDHGPDWGLAADRASRGLVVTDLDGDGWLDVVKAVLDGPTVVLTQRCGAASWLGVDLTDHTSANAHGVGARIVVHAGDRAWTRWIVAGSTGMFSGGPPTAHVGLADVEVVDRVEVWWPDGDLTAVDDVTARQWITVVRNSRG